MDFSGSSTRAIALTQAIAALENAGIVEFTLDAEWLLAGVCGCSRTQLLLTAAMTITKAERENFSQFIQRRAAREPLQYILGTQEFYGLTLQVTPDVLIPRPETEELVAWIVAEHTASHRTSAAVHILDIGTGSGCIACALATEYPRAHITAIDASKLALDVARRNVAALNLNARITLVHGDFFPTAATPFDIIVSNPPYIPTRDVATLQPEVATWEPRTALDGGPDGLGAIRAIIDAAPHHLTPGGTLFLEMGHDQANAVTSYLRKSEKFAQVRTKHDVAGIARFVAATRV